MSFNFMSFLSKYLPSSVTTIIISQKQECVGSRPEEIQVLVKHFLYSFYIHIEKGCKGWSILNILIIHVLQRKNTSFT